jgi:predicted short-subunit dehydrogenase-like oxidoreductase (DUF2520 family)
VDKHVISFAGAGRLAATLCREMHFAGLRIDMIVSESEERGRLLAGICNAKWSDKLCYPDSTEVIIVAVPDHRLKGILREIECNPETLIAHTAGSIGLDVFPASTTRKGVFYPLQTFSHNRKIGFKDLPVFIEASDYQSSELLGDIADSLGGRKYFTDSEHRRMLHLAAVFVCNFTNHMLTQGKVLAQRSGFSFEELKPLIKETFLKALEEGPENSQTGPAVRNDINTIEKHLELLSFDPDLQKIYRAVSGLIYNYHTRLR